jgi:CheY-like chemotaxis protein
MSGVLIVDDDEDTATSLAMLLELDGHHAHISANGIDALEAVEILHPDVILLDISLPGLDGYEVARRLRASHAGRNALVIAHTGWAQEDARTRSRAAGCDHHLVKPAEPDALCRLIATARHA